jgi:hypothetical protein
MEFFLDTKNHCVAPPNVMRKQRFIFLVRFAAPNQAKERFCVETI